MSRDRPNGAAADQDSHPVTTRPAQTEQRPRPSRYEMAQENTEPDINIDGILEMLDDS